MVLSTASSWATLVMAIAFVISVLTVLWVGQHPFKTCEWCDRRFRGKTHYVLDAWLRNRNVCCSFECVDNLNEAAWMGRQT